MTFEILNQHASFGGRQLICRHQSAATKTPMRFSAYVPPQAARGACPVVWFLSGLTCTEENFTVKAGAQRVASELGLVIIAPDTSPRGDGVPDDAAYDFGIGAGFYLDATEAPWSTHFHMKTYIEQELPAVVAANLPVDMARQGITGHSMGGHGALTIALRNPGRFRAVSAFAPIVAPSDVPWGEKALTGYLGPNRTAWRAHDACALIEDGARLPDLLVDQGLADTFLVSQLKPERLESVCAAAGMALTLRRHEGYDHSYFFIATFIGDHLAWHAERLGVGS